MTWLEKFKKDHPTLEDEYIMDEFCPDDGLVSNCPLFDGEVDCRKCWLRTVPEKDGRPMVAPTTGTEPVGAGTARPENAAGPDDDITVAGPVYEPDPDAGLSAEGPDRT